LSAPQELADAALAASGADGCVVVVEQHSAANLRWAASSMTTNGRAAARTMTVVSVHDRAGGPSVGIASRSVTSVAEATALVRASEAAARDGDPVTDCSPLVEPYDVDDDWGAEVPVTGPKAFERLASDLAAAFGRWRCADRLLFGYAEHRMTTTFLATSTGLRRRFDQPDGRLELTGKSHGLQRSAWHGAHVPDPAGLDVAGAVQALERGLGWASREVELPRGRYETILPPAAVADLMICAYQQASARDAHEGRSVFASPGSGDRIGEELSPLPLSLYSDPAEPGLQCQPFDVVTTGESALESVFDNGQPVARAAWIERGRLNELVRTRAWARARGERPRPLVGNLILTGGAGASLEDMVAATERGLLLTSLWYIREVDPQTLLLTGLTRDGVYLVEDGQVTAAVNNFRFNESPIDLLRRVTEVGRTEHTLPRERADAFRRTAMPPLRIADFNMSAVSSAR
jgi:predicted Zn-dependent protease